MFRSPLRALLFGSILALGPASCGDARSVAVARLQSDVDVVDFGEVRHAAIHEIVVPLRNTGTAEARATLAVSGPFLVEADAIELGADTQAELSVFFLPSSYDDAAGELTLRVDGRDTVVDIQATVATDWDQDGAIAEGAGGTDCDDLRDDVAPGLPESCDARDNDCDGEVDEDALDAETFYADADGDGYGDPDAPTVACSLPRDHSESADDCDDTDRLVRPGGSERSDGIDQDCDGRVDEHLLTAGALVITEVHPGLGGSIEAYVELRLGDVPAPIYLQGLEVAVDGRPVSLAGDGVPYAASDDPVLLLCGGDTPGQVDGIDCAGVIPAGPTATSVVDLRSEGTLVDEVQLDGLPFAAGSSVELRTDADHTDNDRAESWCTGSRVLGAGFGSPGSLDHCGEPE